MQKLLTPHVRAIGRPAGPAQDDAIDPAHVEGTPAALKNDLIQLLGREQVLYRISDLTRYASDASPYRYLPQVVVLPRTVDDVRAILGYCARSGRHATFRAGGTSMNGQSQSDDILIDVRRHWTGMVAEDGGARLRARPGTILNHANAVLRPLGRRLGPDPASADVATIGGVIANNAGGMRCTLERNAYHTVSSLTLVLASGTVIDTAAPGAGAAFEAAEPELAAGLMQLRSELLADDELTQRVRHKFAIRNTNGYALLALLDGDTPLEIFRRLIVGSEGTLAFVAEAVIGTIPAPAMTTVSWVVLPSITEAAALVPGLVGLGAAAVELMLAPALAAAAQTFPGALSTGAVSTPAPRRCWWSSARTARPGSMPQRPKPPHSSPARASSTPSNSPVTRNRSRCTGRSATGSSALSDSSALRGPLWSSRTSASPQTASPRAPRISRSCCPSTASCRTQPGTRPTATCTSR
jgi:D-lactate dehydrogenase